MIDLHSKGYMGIFLRRQLWYLKEIKIEYGTDMERTKVTDENSSTATLVSSNIQKSDLHLPVIDVDFDAHLIPSSTTGHSHLYLNKPMTWKRYKKLLKALWKAGVIEEGFYTQSIARKGTYVRVPWVKK